MYVKHCSLDLYFIVNWLALIKVLDHTKMKILSLITHPHAVPNP